MEDPEVWRWIWLVAAFAFAAGELTTPGSFFLAPFAVGAAAATALAFLDVNIGIQWVVFAVVSIGSLFALRPLARRLDQAAPARGIGARRLIGEEGVVLNSIPGGPAALGLVRIGREEWRAESVGNTPVAVGTNIRVVEVTGTRVVVWPDDGQPAPVTPPVREN